MDEVTFFRVDLLFKRSVEVFVLLLRRKLCESVHAGSKSSRQGSSKTRRMCLSWSSFGFLCLSLSLIDDYENIDYAANEKA